MALSAITSITQGGQYLELSSFIRSGIVYVLWHFPTDDIAVRKLCWKPHNGADFSEVVPTLYQAYSNVSAIYVPTDDSLLVCWNTLTGANGTLFSARFNPLTGAVLSGPTLIGEGRSPRLTYRGTTPSGAIVLYSLYPSTKSVYGRLSSNGGLSWKSAVPLISGQVSQTDFVEVVSYDESHVSVAQLGADSRALTEIGLFSRTRPLSCIAKHPTLANRYFVGEPSQLLDGSNPRVLDNLRGGIAPSRDGTKLFWLNGVRQGTNDSIGSVALLDTSGASITVSSSQTPALAAPSDDLVDFPLPAFTAGTETDLFGVGSNGLAVSFDQSETHVYVAGYQENASGVSSPIGTADVYRISDRARATFLASSATRLCRAVGVGVFPAAVPTIFLATTDAGVEKLRVYSENDLTPTFLNEYKLGARANSIRVVMDSSTTGTVFVSMTDRLNIYRYDSTQPFRLLDSYNFSSRGRFLQTQMAPNGVTFAACGEAGVLAISPSGKILSQVTCSPLSVPSWTASTVYALGTLIRPRTVNQFYPSRFYFRASTGGTSGTAEPLWAATGTVIDNTAQWQVVGLVDSVVSGIALDVAAKKIYAVGVAGGLMGTAGRVWTIDASKVL